MAVEPFIRPSLTISSRRPCHSKTPKLRTWFYFSPGIFPKILEHVGKVYESQRKCSSSRCCISTLTHNPEIILQALCCCYFEVETQTRNMSQALSSSCFPAASRRDSKKTGRYHVLYCLRCVLWSCFLGVSCWDWSLFWEI